MILAFAMYCMYKVAPWSRGKQQLSLSARSKQHKVICVVHLVFNQFLPMHTLAYYINCHFKISSLKFTNAVVILS